VTAADLFEYTVELPDAAINKTASTLIGFDERYDRIVKNLRLMSDPESLKAWSQQHYGSVTPIIERVSERYPLFILAGDVGTGKTAFARCAANRFAEHMKRPSTLFALSTRVRGEGRVGEASSRINSAFTIVHDALGKSKLCTILIDEADSLVTTRGEEHAHLEDKVAVNTIIQKIDDLRRHAGRLVAFLATNRLRTLDAAVMRRAASVEQFERPNTSERKQIFTLDLSGLQLSPDVIATAVEWTGPHDDTIGFTFGDIRTRLLPEILMQAFPDRKITGPDVLNALQKIKPSPVMS
jgi:AAA+ superfamily predicted ATPase